MNTDFVEYVFRSKGNCSVPIICQNDTISVKYSAYIFSIELNKDLIENGLSPVDLEKEYGEFIPKFENMALKTKNDCGDSCSCWLNGK